MANNANERIVNMDTEELTEELYAAQDQYSNMKFEHATKGLENPMDLRSTRRDIARMKTELRAREISNQSSKEE